MTNDEKVEYLLKMFIDDYGNIDLSHIDFGDRVVYNNHQKATEINNDGQIAIEIYNSYQKATKIFVSKNRSKT